MKIEILIWIYVKLGPTCIKYCTIQKNNVAMTFALCAAILPVLQVDITAGPEENHDSLASSSIRREMERRPAS
jgi:hypothetical protein